MLQKSTSADGKISANDVFGYFATSSATSCLGGSRLKRHERVGLAAYRRGTKTKRVRERDEKRTLFESKIRKPTNRLVKEKNW